MHPLLKITLLCVLVLATHATTLQEEVQKVILKARQNIWDEIEPHAPVWNFPPWLGTLFLSEYHFELKALNLTDLSKFNLQFFKLKLFREQNPDGSWHQIVDLNRGGSLDATIMNYWFLKDVGLDYNHPALAKAREFILANGGLEAAQVMTQYKLASFGQYSWDYIPYIPLFLFKNWWPFSYSYIKNFVAQWVYPHLTGLAYLRYHRTVFSVSNVCISELMNVTSNKKACYTISSPHPQLTQKQSLDSDVANLVAEMAKLRGARGSYGAYTISTLLTLLSLEDYENRYDLNQSLRQEDKTTKFEEGRVHPKRLSFQFVEENYFNRRVPYDGSLDDGRYWDTILASLALLEAGEEPSKLIPTVDFMYKYAVQESGGIPYGEQFEYAPDIDDTAMLLLLYAKFPNNHYAREIQKTKSWLESMQNRDGGFPAFDTAKNDNDFPLLKFVFWITKISKSAEIFDPSCADIVGHLLQGFGQAGVRDSKAIPAAIEFLKKTQDTSDTHLWVARWGINYVYAAGAVIPGLSRIGYDLREEWIANTIKGLVKLQQSDGGFGEDSESYNTGRYLEGKTTATMTAWGLLALLEVRHIYDVQENIESAVQYLLNNFEGNGGRFFDRSVVGTGHRGVLNLQYPVYAYSFPLIALSRYLNTMVAAPKNIACTNCNSTAESEDTDL